MPNVNALKKFAKKKINGSFLKNKKEAKKGINNLNIKRTNEKFLVEQKIFNKLMELNGNLASNFVFNPVTQRLLSVKPLPKSVKKSIRRSSPTTSGRTARRQAAMAGAVVLSRRGIPRGPAQKILDELLRPSSQRQRR
jgi:hypothetical protein